MVREWDHAPDFTVPMARPENAGNRGSYTSQDVESFTLSDRLVYGPVVLAFFPGVYSRTCTQELRDVREWRTELSDLDAQVFGVSVDTPWSQLAFIEEYELDYPLLSGFNSDVIADYGLRIDEGLLAGIAARGIFVIDTAQSVVYRWVGDDLTTLPDLDEVERAVQTAQE